MIHIINEKDNRNKTIMVIPESEASKKEATKYGIDLDGDLDGDTIKMTDGKIFRFPNMR